MLILAFAENVSKKEPLMLDFSTTRHSIVEAREQLVQASKRLTLVNEDDKVEEIHPLKK